MIKFIKATVLDKPYLLTLRLNTMVEHLEKQGLFLSLEQHQARVAEHFEHSHLVFAEAQCVGLAKFTREQDHINLLQLQIEPTEQGKGLGTKVLHALKNEANVINLTVLKANPAYGLYQRAGFKTIGEDDYEFHMQWQK
ncbi:MULTISPECIES: GNAT family N-acetyltransferase [Pseudoalteromonas]|uniref:GNAT family N-acetyltransferase n=1 Tax=Pseudoalteromonas TaxID=53246 RepID=UPI000824A17E|nr:MULTISPECIES: GNAT family N-acetyltransferase [Pseudoalteromonas]MCC9661941.1 GNAT family N-acetyltransferase [Pseudoalteromonas sp. MB41]